MSNGSKKRWLGRVAGTLLFPEKEAKSVCSARLQFPRRSGPGLAPENPYGLVVLFFFQKKKQKALALRGFNSPV
jgi:hypothetical protein